MKPVPHVLLLDDNTDIAELFIDLLKGRCVIIWTTLPHEAEAIVRGDIELSAIIVDGKLSHGTTEESEAFVRKIKPIYDGPIVACSAHPDYSDRLMAAGCTHKLREKHEIDQFLKRLLGLPSEPP